MDANMFGTCTAAVPTFTKPIIEIYPNPTTEAIQVTGLQDAGQLLILDLSGKVIQFCNYQSQTTQIDLTQLQNGIYFISEPTKGIYERIIKQ
jgi:hypothetical protein